MKKKTLGDKRDVSQVLRNDVRERVIEEVI